MRDNPIAEYGSWRSPITSDLIVAETIRLSDVMLDGPDVYWLEMRPSESGRCVIVRCTPDGQTTDVTPSDYNVRTRVHEYGGRSFAVAAGDVYFSNFEDQCLYFQQPHTAPARITSDTDQRVADMIVDHWNPSKKRHRFETFCYGPKSCSYYRAGPRRKVPGRKGMSYTEEDWVDENCTAHRDMDD